MVEGYDIFVLPSTWVKREGGYTIPFEVVEPPPGDPEYRLTGEALDRLLREAGFVPIDEEPV